MPIIRQFRGVVWSALRRGNGRKTTTFRPPFTGLLSTQALPSGTTAIAASFSHSADHSQRGQGGCGTRMPRSCTRVPTQLPKVQLVDPFGVTICGGARWDDAIITAAESSERGSPQVGAFTGSLQVLDDPLFLICEVVRFVVRALGASSWFSARRSVMWSSGCLPA